MAGMNSLGLGSISRMNMRVINSGDELVRAGKMQRADGRVSCVGSEPVGTILPMAFMAAIARGFLATWLAAAPQEIGFNI